MCCGTETKSILDLMIKLDLMYQYPSVIVISGGAKMEYYWTNVDAMKLYEDGIQRLIEETIKCAKEEFEKRYYNKRKGGK